MFNKLLSLIAGTLMLATASVKADVVVASAGPMSGQYASFGSQLKAGAEMWLKHVNKKGGINGEKVKLEIGDDACDPKQAVAVANKFAGQGVAYVAGHFCSGSSIPASAVYNEEGIIQVSPASTNPALTDKGGKYTFRVCGRDDQQGEVAGKFLADNYKGKKVAILHDKTAYGKGLADATRKNMKKAGPSGSIPAALNSFTTLAAAGLFLGSGEKVINVPSPAFPVISQYSAVTNASPLINLVFIPWSLICLTIKPPSVW